MVLVNIHQFFYLVKIIRENYLLEKKKHYWMKNAITRYHC